MTKARWRVDYIEVRQNDKWVYDTNSQSYCNLTEIDRWIERVKNQYWQYGYIKGQ